ncbi:MAG: CHAP domain-containing protein [Clostridia bacterium]|nr:CHAP domain-containing protein [Clostridia bacterium]
MKEAILTKIRIFLRESKLHRRLIAVFLCLATLVSSGTLAMITLTGVTMTAETTLCCPFVQHEHSESCLTDDGLYQCAYAAAHLHDEMCYDADGNLICSMPEIAPHTHDDSCYETVQELICGMEEGGEEGHVHSEECYTETQILTCPLQELPVHQHTAECFAQAEEEASQETEAAEDGSVSDPTADVESYALWDQMASAMHLSGKWDEDVLTIAKAQLGYRESERNFELVDGVKKGYTRYGAWYGLPYEDWCAMFISFCLSYAEIPETEMPRESGVDRWIDLLAVMELYHCIPEHWDEPDALPEDSYLPKPGDLIFFREQYRTGSSHVGIVCTVDETEGLLTTIEGNSDNCVQVVTYLMSDPRIMGYGVLPEEPHYTLTERYTAEDGTVYTVTVEYNDKAEIPEDATLSVSEPTPEEYAAYLAQTAAALHCDEDTVNELRLLDITILSAGAEIQPQRPVNVTIRPENTVPQEDTQIVHFGEETELIDSETVDGEIRFETEGFSVYGIVGSTIEQSVLASDGSTYRVTVTYDETAGVPEGAQLLVSELNEEAEDYGDLVAMSESALGLPVGAADRIRLFDIKIVDRDGEKVEIAAPVDVRIELEGESAADALTQNSKVVHIADGAESGEVIGDAQIEGESVRFTANGFSAYAIINAPDAADTGIWELLSSMSELEAHIQNGDGIYIGHVDGYYATSGVTKVNSSRNGITKTEPPQIGQPTSEAVPYYFETVNAANHQYKIYCMNGANRKYVQQSGNSLNFVNSASSGSVFTIEDFGNDEDTNVFRIRGANNYCWNMQGGANGHCFAAYNNLNDVNARFNFWYFTPPTDDPYDLDGKTYGLMFFNNGLTGKAMMSNESVEGALEAVSMTVLARNNDREDIIFTPKDSGITRWTFHNIESDVYRITAQVGGETKYLRIDPEDGVTLVDENEIDDGCAIQIVAGGAGHDGEIFLRSRSNAVLTYSGASNIGFFVGGTVSSEWMRLVEETELTPEYYMVHTADKVSISDRESVPDGSKVIVYTRVWDNQNKRYNFYAVASDGSLIPVYESGDQIQWFGDRFNTLLWDFTEYQWEDGSGPNGYYELYNEFSGKYIAPQLSSNQILSDNKIGINLNGRKNGYYYSNILAWDDASYAYAGVDAHIGNTASDRYIEPCSINATTDFYFALVHDLPSDDVLTEVPTVDNNLYGITMKMVNFGGTTYKDGKNPETTLMQHSVIGDSTGGSVLYPNSGLLTNSLDANGYPTATITGASLADLFNSPSNPPVEVNHLFLQSILDGSGYFEYDSTQNFATLKNQNNSYGTDFHVYQELGSYDGGSSRPSLKHGQFFPYDNIEPGNFCTNLNPRNLYTATQQELLEGDPRKNERLYKVENPDYYFGMQLEASFVQTPSGHDSWGHDIIYEFTGDDDFWLYVDGELVIDLGGIHSALAGTVNFCTGDVYVNGVHTTLYDTFRSNYIDRYKEANNGSEPTEAELEAYLIGTAENNYKDGIFESDGMGHMVFKDYTSHTMTIFYMERGAGASNLHMRFNLASVKAGTVQLSKELDGNLDEAGSVEAVFPYQIWYVPGDGSGSPQLDPNTGDPIVQRLTVNDPNTYVFYKDTNTRVPYAASKTIDGITYNDVFLLKPGETAEIKFPDDTIFYKIIECGVDTRIFDSVTVDTSDDNEVLNEIQADLNNDHRFDYALDYETAAERPRVVYTNHVDDDALRDLTIRKRLFAEDGVTEIHHDDPIFGADSAIFNFRLYFKPENDSSFVGASLYPYHVKDNHGNYCYWDVANQCFASLNETDFNNLSAADKLRATFNTSMNGSISKIPVDYDVEIREILAGTEFRVQERDYEIPDGYSLRNYTLKFGESDPGTDTNVPAQGTLPSDNTEDPIVEVNNIKGWGLRVNKVWNDEDYMEDRDPIYVAVFVGNSQTPFVIETEEDDGQGGTVITQTSTIRRLDYGEHSMYWYIPSLASGTTFNQYHVCEVELTNPTVDSNGIVTAYDTLTVVDDGDTTTLQGVQEGFNTTASFTYTVDYEQGAQETGSNVRVDTITNSRPGVKLYKVDWDDEPLADAEFTLTLGNTTIGPFVSDEDGLITEALLGENVDYVLNEVRATQGYYGIEAPLTLRLTQSNGAYTLTVTPDQNAPADIGYFYTVEQNGANGMPELKVKNRTYTLRFDKQDGDTGDPLPGVTFSLHREVTVNGVTGIDFTPLPGYSSLVTDANGVILGLDQTLPHGIYYLKETAALPGYETMTGYLRFSIGEKGNVEILSEGRENWLTKSVNQAGDTVVYTLAVPNVKKRVDITLQKVGYDNTQSPPTEYPVSGAVFNIYESDGTTLLTLDGVVQQNLTDSGDGVFFSGALLVGTYYVEEVSPPAAYTALPGRMLLTITASGAALQGTWTSGDPNHSVGMTTGSVAAGYVMTVRNSAGYELPATGGSGVLPVYAAGATLCMLGALVLRRRRKRKYSENP